MTIEIVSVNTGPVTYLGTWRGRPVRSGIRKTPVTTQYVLVTPQGLAGDEQADLRVHGGLDKAIYVYPVEHLQAWSAELGCDLQPGSFGENLTVRGILEHEVRVGDIWIIGGQQFEVTKPRRPCYKLSLLHGAKVSRAMLRNGRCGWYLKPLGKGKIRTSGTIRVLRTSVGNPTISAVFARKVSEEPTVHDMPE